MGEMDGECVRSLELSGEAEEHGDGGSEVGVEAPRGRLLNALQVPSSATWTCLASWRASGRQWTQHDLRLPWSPLSAYARATKSPPLT